MNIDDSFDVYLCYLKSVLKLSLMITIIIIKDSYYNKKRSGDDQ